LRPHRERLAERAGVWGRLRPHRERLAERAGGGRWDSNPRVAGSRPAPLTSWVRPQCTRLGSNQPLRVFNAALPPGQLRVHERHPLRESNPRPLLERQGSWNHWTKGALELVEGFEPSLSCLRVRCSSERASPARLRPRGSNPDRPIDAARRHRAETERARPGEGRSLPRVFGFQGARRPVEAPVVRGARIELACRDSEPRGLPLSYPRKMATVSPGGVKPPARCLRGSRSIVELRARRRRWARRESNPRPFA
jgi:hypothetical protein